MKNYILYAAGLLATLTASAQQDMNTAADAVRYSLNNLTGTARFRAMSGAFGAVGGDLSAIGVNPAGAAVFMYNTGTASLSSYNLSNSSNYYGTGQRQNDNTFDLNQLGAVFVFNNNNEGAFMNKFTLGFNYENTNSFENSIGMHGVSPNSLDRYFLRYANGINGEGAFDLSLADEYFDTLSFLDQQAYLGYKGYIFNPNEAPTGAPYVSNTGGSGNYYQESYISTTGFNGKVALNFATQLKERFYVGANLNIHFTDYINNTSLYENTNNPFSDGLRSFRFDTERYTYGGGFSLNLGAIAKITDSFRAGVAYESPTWLRLQDETTQSIVSNVGGSTIVTNPYVTSIGDDYTIKTPSKYTGSLAYIFGRSGLLSVDYSVRDYSNTKYSTSRYEALNTELASTLDWAGELRIGGEYRIKNLSLRGGYRYQQSPYKNGRNVGDLYGATGGVGFNLGGSRIDLAYSWYQRKSETPLFTPGLTDNAQVKTTGNNVTLSYTIDL
ncbi:transporter [Flavobacterium sp. Sd200]|uniref:OmpP1/FadL family transporter n=1 Tax=Flavobacterium sp. Sd200 TaxID=2692211 RepID=UPI00136C03E0|nr:outer membrane protein transport protein [Flavobacterium sp. Sd200]MXN91648.1 transporter [Flavobacterium sp. Sd200]